MFNIYAKKWGDRYVTSNVKIWNRDSGAYEYPGVTHRYFTTDMGLRVMAFGVLFDFGGMMRRIANLYFSLLFVLHVLYFMGRDPKKEEEEDSCVVLDL